jgi:hypothetical protein
MSERWTYITTDQAAKPHVVAWFREVLPDGRKRLVVFIDECYGTVEEAVAAATLLEAECNATSPRSFAPHQVCGITLSPASRDGARP